MKKNTRTFHKGTFRRITAALLAVCVAFGGVSLSAAGEESPALGASGDAPQALFGAAAQTDDPVLIHNAAALAAMDPTGNYKLADDITLTEEWTPLAIPTSTSGPFFTGTLDGDGHAIRGLWTTHDSASGLIAYMNEGGVVKNLRIELDDRGMTSVDSEAAGLVGTMLGGQIENCHVTGTVTGVKDWTAGLLVGDMLGGTVSQCAAEGSVTGFHQLGGLVGYMEGDVAIEDSYSLADVSGVSSVGGLVGEMEGGSISRSYAGKGTVYGSNDPPLTGLFLGDWGEGEIFDCYFEKADGQEGVGRDGRFDPSDPPIGLTTERLTGGVRLDGFADIWWYADGEYPRFKTDGDTPGEGQLPEPTNVTFTIEAGLSGWSAKASFSRVTEAGSYKLRLYGEDGKVYGGVHTASALLRASTSLNVNMVNWVKRAIQEERRSYPNKTAFSYTLSVAAAAADGGPADSNEVKSADACTFQLLTELTPLEPIVCNRNDDITGRIPNKMTGIADGDPVTISLVVGPFLADISAASKMVGRHIVTVEANYPMGVVNALDLQHTMEIHVYGKHVPPGTPRWDTATPGKAVWTMTERARAVNVQLLRDGIPVGEWKTVPYGAEQSYFFLPMMRDAGAGSYTFRIKTLGSMDGYFAESDTVVSPVPYAYAGATRLTIRSGTVATKVYDGSTAATVTGVAFDGLRDGDALTLGVDYIVTDAHFADAGVGQDKPVTATVTLTETATALKYALADTRLQAVGVITQTAGMDNPAYAAALEQLKAVHIITNLTPILADVSLPTGWSFTSGGEDRPVADNGNGGYQSFSVRYTSADPSYADVTLVHPFPVSTVVLDMEGGLGIRVMNRIGDTPSLVSGKPTVIGAPLPDTGEYSIANMEWRSSCPAIVAVTGNAMADGGLTATATARDKGVSLVGVAYKHSGEMLGYLLIQVVEERGDSANTAEQIHDIADTLTQLIDREGFAETDTQVVNAVADEVTKLPEAVKNSLTQEDLQALEELKIALNKNLRIVVITDPEGAPPQPRAMTVFGAAIASGVDSGLVEVFATPVAPTSADVQLEIELDMRVDGDARQLLSPLFFTIELPDGVDASRLRLRHIRSDGSAVDVAFTSVGQTVFFKLGSFSSLQFLATNTPGKDADRGRGSGGSSVGDTARAYHSIVATAHGGGAISPSGIVHVERLRDQTFQVVPDEGWRVDRVLLDGEIEASLKNGRYTFISVTAAHRIDVYFVEEDAPERPADPIPENPETGGDGPDTPRIPAGVGAATDSPPSPATAPAEALEDDVSPVIAAPPAKAEAVPPQPAADTAPTSEAGAFCLIDWLSGGQTHLGCRWCWVVLLAVPAGGVLYGVRRKRRVGAG